LIALSGPDQITVSINRKGDQERVELILHSIAAAFSQFEGELEARPSQSSEKLIVTGRASTLGP
jgi:hypothetical protein